MAIVTSRRVIDVLRLATGSADHRREVLRRLRATPRAVVTTMRALLKWRTDRKSLPLTRHHLWLYLRIHRYCNRVLGRFPDLIAPSGMNDLTHWLKLFDQTELHPLLSDKIAVREYVAGVVGEKYLNEVYGVLDNAKELLELDLPAPCIIKANHDSGSATIVRDWALIDRAALARRMGTRLRSRAGHASGEWPYALIRPRILVEELLPEGLADGAPDFKFHCVEGRVVLAQYIYGRLVSPAELLLDRSGEVVIGQLDFNFAAGDLARYRRPSCWAELIDVAERLASGWKHIRVDLYASLVGIRFGELTFFPQAGCYPGPGEKDFAHLLNFDRTTFRAPLTVRQRRGLRTRPAQSSLYVEATCAPTAPDDSRLK